MGAPPQRPPGRASIGPRGCRAWRGQRVTPSWRQPRGKWMVSLVKSYANATSQRLHLWEIDLRLALNLSPEWFSASCSLRLRRTSRLSCVARRAGTGFRVQGSGFGVLGSGFRVQGSGFRARGCRAWRGEREQGCLAHKKQLPPRTLH